jgi:CheY-like chemotaxis protein
MTAPLVTIFDDEPEIRRMLGDALGEAGFHMPKVRCCGCLSTGPST